MLKEKIFVEFNLKIDVLDNLKTTYMIAKLDGLSNEEVFIGAHTDGYFSWGNGQCEWHCSWFRDG